MEGIRKVDLNFATNTTTEETLEVYINYPTVEEITQIYFNWILMVQVLELEATILNIHPIREETIKTYFIIDSTQLVASSSSRAKAIMAIMMWVAEKGVACKQAEGDFNQSEGQLNFQNFLLKILHFSRDQCHYVRDDFIEQLAIGG